MYREGTPPTPGTGLDTCQATTPPRQARGLPHIRSHALHTNPCFRQARDGPQPEDSPCRRPAGVRGQAAPAERGLAPREGMTTGHSLSVEEETQHPTCVSRSREGGRGVRGSLREDGNRTGGGGRLGGVDRALARFQARPTCSPGVSRVKPHNSSAVLLFSSFYG